VAALLFASLLKLTYFASVYVYDTHGRTIEIIASLSLTAFQAAVNSMPWLRCSPALIVDVTLDTVWLTSLLVLSRSNQVSCVFTRRSNQLPSMPSSYCVARSGLSVGSTAPVFEMIWLRSGGAKPVLTLP